jgi:hypothetical protein
LKQIVPKFVVNVSGWTSTPSVAREKRHELNPIYVTKSTAASAFQSERHDENIPMYFFSNSPVKWRYGIVEIST